MSKQYVVNYWGSEPGTNDDCWTGWDFDTIEEARAKYEARVAYENPAMSTIDVAYVELDGPDVHEERRNPDFKPSRRDDDEWQREIEREHLMLHGSLDA